MFLNRFYGGMNGEIFNPGYPKSPTEMGKIANLFIGLFIALAGYVLTLVNSAVGASAAKSPLPFDVTLVLGYISTGFLVIGGVLVGYSLVAGGYSVIMRIFGSSTPRKDEEPRKEKEKERYRKEEDKYEEKRPEDRDRSREREASFEHDERREGKRENEES